MRALFAPPVVVGLLVVAAVVSGANRILLARGQEPQRFRSGVDVVEVAVLARDGAGRLVTDLVRGDITILENGAPQEIVAFERVSLPTFRPASSRPTEEPARDVTTNEAIAQARVFVLVLDALHVAPARNLAVRQHARRFIEQYIGPGDLAAVISPGGAAAATEDFTNDKARLFAAVDSFVGTKLRSATLERAEEKRMADFSGIQMHGGKDPSDSERANRVYSLTSTLEALARHLDRIEGRRKALLLFSEGVEYDTSDIMGVAQRDASEVMRAMGRAVDALMRTNVAMYTIDPRLLGSVQGDLIEAPLYEARPGAPDQLSERGIGAEQDASIRSLRDLAQATGGFLASDKGLARAFAQIAEESSDYYILGYTPQKAAKPGETRTITVRTSRPGVTITARKGYRMPAPVHQAVASQSAVPSMPTGVPGRSRREVSHLPLVETVAPAAAGVASELPALLASPLPKAGLPIRVQAIPFRGSGSRRDVQIVIEVLGKALEFKTRGERAEERIELAMLSVNDSGRGANGRSTTIDLRLLPAEVQRVRATGVRWLSKVQLEPGRHQLRIAARASGTGLSGLVTHVVDVPSVDATQLSMSGVTLTSLPSVLMLTRGEAWLQEILSTPPSAARTFVAGDQVTAAVEIYAPGPLRAALTLVAAVEQADGTKVVIVQGRAREAGRSRSVEAAFPIDTATLPPGRYILRVTASHEPGRASTERRVPFTVIRSGA